VNGKSGRRTVSDEVELGALLIVPSKLIGTTSNALMNQQLRRNQETIEQIIFPLNCLLKTSLFLLNHVKCNSVERC
jgi:hypothetical protein